MVAGVALVTILVAACASFFMAWAIGAGSSGSTPFAPAVGARAISVMRAGFLVGILGFAGAVFQGQNVGETMGRGLVEGVGLSPEAASVGLLTAAVLVAIGIFTGYPIATAFTATGAIVGVGLALGGAPAWDQYRAIGTLWLLVPFVGGGIAYATARLLRSERVSERVAVPVLGAIVGAIVANIEFAVIGPPGEGGSIASVVSTWIATPTVLGLEVGHLAITMLLAVGAAVAIERQVARNRTRGEQRFLLALGALVAFSAGGSQVGLAIGPLFPLLDGHVPIFTILVGGGLGLLVGSWTGAPRMIKAISRDYSSLGPRRSIAALIPSFAIAQVAVLFGLPVSFNQIVVCAVIGSGFAAGSGGVSGRKMGYTVFAWVGSLVASGVIAYGVFSLFFGL